MTEWYDLNDSEFPIVEKVYALNIEHCYAFWNKATQCFMYRCSNVKEALLRKHRETTTYEGRWREVDMTDFFGG